MKKRALSIILVLASILLAFSLTSCGMLEGIFDKDEEEELTFSQITKNIERTDCYAVASAKGEENSREILAGSIDDNASYEFDGKLKKAAAYTDGNWRIVVFECGSKSQAKELRSIVASYDNWGGCYEVEESFLLVSNSYDIIEIALGERKYTGSIGTSTGSSNTDTSTSTGSTNTDSDHNHNTDTNPDTSIDGCYHRYDSNCDEYCNICDEMRTATGDHLYDNDCDAYCNKCDAIREVDDHRYDDDCSDTTCNSCGAVREAIEHVYENCDDTTCANCAITREAIGHLYPDDCVAYCIWCGVEREAPHRAEYVGTVAPTCISGGYDMFVCYCGFTKHTNFTEPSYAPEAHSYKKVGVDPTCTSDGYKDEICELCGSNSGVRENLPALGHNYVNGYCTRCSVYTRDGNTIYFGTYPQIMVADGNLESTLNTLAGDLPTSYDSYAWTSYGYYENGEVSNYMWYIDIEEDGEKYRGVYFTSYRPYYCSNSSSTGDTYQDDNGYTTSNIYWFKYEPISWTILNENNGTALILCDMIIDSQQFDYENGNYYNDYAESTVRRWLNDNFYNTAFDELQKEIILTTTVDNSVASTGYGSNPYACNDTEDKVFLLSYEEATTYFTSDTARQKKTTDYAQSQGAWTSTSSSYLGNGYWRLRSPCDNDSRSARYVYDGGGIYDIGVYGTFYGVVPALQIQLN